MKISSEQNLNRTLSHLLSSSPMTQQSLTPQNSQIPILFSYAVDDSLDLQLQVMMASEKVGGYGGFEGDGCFNIQQMAA